MQTIGIPTTYQGVRFRSRTEARFAALFDEFEWPWQYEPFDLNRYVPDFILKFPPGDLLVEVKGPLEHVELAQFKIEASEWNKEALVLVQLDGAIIGRIWDWSGGEPVWCDAELFRCLSCGMTSVLAREGSWRCRLCGVGGDNSHVGQFDQVDAWSSSGNRVQWRAA